LALPGTTFTVEAVPLRRLVSTTSPPEPTVASTSSVWALISSATS
jgi:hypothetical protein